MASTARTINTTNAITKPVMRLLLSLGVSPIGLDTLSVGDDVTGDSEGDGKGMPPPPPPPLEGMPPPPLEGMPPPPPPLEEVGTGLPGVGVDVGTIGVILRVLEVGVIELVTTGVEDGHPITAAKRTEIDNNVAIIYVARKNKSIIHKCRAKKLSCRL